MTAGKAHCTGTKVPVTEQVHLPAAGGTVTFVTMCGCYAGDCPQMAKMPDGGVAIRNHGDPGTVVIFDADESAEFFERIRAGDPFSA